MLTANELLVSVITTCSDVVTGYLCLLSSGNYICLFHVNHFFTSLLDQYISSVKHLLPSTQRENVFGQFKLKLGIQN